jgi:hypothetical protein
MMGFVLLKIYTDDEKELFIQVFSYYDNGPQWGDSSYRYF